jgi:hypothetical protein
MAVLNLNYLKTLFSQYDKPTEQDFSDLIDTLSTTIDIVTYSVIGTGDVWTDANLFTTIVHNQKQLTVIYHNGKTYLFDAVLGKYGLGGIPTNSSNFVDIIASQFTDEQVIKIIELITDDISVVSSLDITEFEKGLSTTVKYNAVISHKDVTVSSIKLNNVSQQINQSGTTTVNKTDLLTNSKNYTLSISYIRLGVSKQYTETIFTTAYVPQFYGTSLTLDYDNQNVQSIALTKYIGSDTELNYSGVLNNVYLWFIVVKQDNTLYDQNGFIFRHGDWNSNEFFIYKQGLITLADGTNSQVSLYRSFNKLTSKTRTYKFKIQ